MLAVSLWLDLAGGTCTLRSGILDSCQAPHVFELWTNTYLLQLMLFQWCRLASSKLYMSGQFFQYRCQLHPVPVLDLYVLQQKVGAINVLGV